MKTDCQNDSIMFPSHLFALSLPHSKLEKQGNQQVKSLIGEK